MERSNENDLLYLVHDINHQGKLTAISFTKDYQLAEENAKLHGLSNKHVIAMRGKRFDEYCEKINENEVIIEEIERIDGMAMTVSEYEYVSCAAADEIYDLLMTLKTLKKTLRLFKGDEGIKFAEAVDKFRKRLGRDYNERIETLHNRLRLRKFAARTLQDVDLT